MDVPAVLIVEDEVLIRLSTADFLREFGHYVLEAASADEALAVLKANDTVAVVLSDVRMPGELDGIALAAIVRRTWPHVPVVLTSSHLPEDVDVEPDLFIQKPYSQSRIVTLVEQLIGESWKNTPAQASAS